MPRIFIATKNVNSFDSLTSFLNKLKDSTIREWDHWKSIEYPLTLVIEYKESCPKCGGETTEKLRMSEYKQVSGEPILEGRPIYGVTGTVLICTRCGEETDQCNCSSGKSTKGRKSRSV